MSDLKEAWQVRCGFCNFSAFYGSMRAEEMTADEMVVEDRQDCRD